MDYLSLPPDQAEAMIFASLTAYANHDRKRWSDIGLMADAVVRGELWKMRIDPADGLPCRSWARWCAITPYPYKTQWAAMQDVRELLPDVSAEDISQIPQSNLVTMKQLSTKVRGDEKVLDIAKHGRTEQLVDYIREHHADQHIESRRILKFTPDESAAEKIEEALAEAENHGARGRNDGLELICATVMEIWRMEALVEQAHEQTTEGS